VPDQGTPFIYRVFCPGRPGGQSVDRGPFCSIILMNLSAGACVIKKTLGITLAIVISACVLLVTIVLVLQVVLSLVGAE
jgi:hypothetical protein